MNEVLPPAPRGRRPAWLRPALVASAATAAVALAVGAMVFLHRPAPAAHARTHGHAHARSAPAYRISIDQAVRGFMDARYGKYDARLDGWREASASTDTTAFRICARREVAVKDRNLTLLAVCNEDSTIDPPERNTVDLYVLSRDAAGDMREEASQENAESGGGSTRLFDVDVVRLGRDFYGFRVDSSYTADGWVVGGMSIHVPRTGRIVTALGLSTSAENEGTTACGDDSRSCLSFEREVRIDESQPDAVAYPVDVVAATSPDHLATRGPHGRLFATLNFDATQGRYVMPPGFQVHETAE